MNTPLRLIAFLAVALISSPAFAQTESPKAATSPVSVTTAPMSAPTGQPSEADMMKQMMEMSKLNENHKLLGELAGTWDYTVKFWMNPDPNAKPEESKGTAVRKPIMDGRFYILDVTGTMQMPGENGKKKPVTFTGKGLEGYDNVKKKFVGTWVDNMGTGVMTTEGTYDPTTKTFTFTGEVEMMPGMKQQIREVMKIVDKNHHTFEWYENRGGTEAKTMEINYTRKK